MGFSEEQVPIAAEFLVSIESPARRAKHVLPVAGATGPHSLTITFTCSHGVDHVSASSLDGGEVDTGGSRHRQGVCRAPPCQRSKSMHYFRWEQAQGCSIHENRPGFILPLWWKEFLRRITRVELGALMIFCRPAGQCGIAIYDGRPVTHHA